MPKVKLGQEPKNDEVIGIIAKYVAIRKMTNQDLMEKVGMKHSKFYDRMGNPEKYTLEELRVIFDAISVPKEERGKFI